jgi:hypothetical protein
MTAASTPPGVPGLAELLGRIEEITPILASNVEEPETSRRIPKANIDA